MGEWCLLKTVGLIFFIVIILRSVPTQADDQAPTTEVREAPLSCKKAMGRSLGWTFGLLGTGGVLFGVGVGIDTPGLTGSGLIVGLLGLFIGPSVGHVYLGNSVQAGRTTLGRGLLFLVAGGMLVGYAARTPFGHHDSVDTTLLVISGAAAAGGLALAIYDLLTIPRATRKANEELKSRTPTTLLTPMFAPLKNGRSALGLGVVGTF